MSRRNSTSLAGNSCYACAQPAVSWEHAPAKGFYPPKKIAYTASSGNDFRRGLIVVPSCREHNADKSQDDNFVQTMMALFGAAYAGRFSEKEENPFLVKLKERLHGHPRMQRVLRDTAELVDTPEGPMVALRPEVDVIISNIELTARALYFHEHGHQQRWPGMCQINSPHFDMGMTPVAPWVGMVLQKFRDLALLNYTGFALKGPHPEIFAYQLLETSERTVMRMTFYESFELLAISGTLNE